MKPIKIAAANAFVTLTIGAVIVPSSLAGLPNWVAEGPFGRISRTLAAGTPAPPRLPLAKEVAVLTEKGISPVRARQALEVQGKIPHTNLVTMLEAALGRAYAGLWFEPALAEFHVGVTSDAHKQTVERVLAQAGLSAYVVATPVRSTWTALIHTQHLWNMRLANLLATGQATTGIDPPHNAVSITLSSLVPSEERLALKRNAADSLVTVSISAAPPVQLHMQQKATCVEPFAANEAYCEPTIVSGVSSRVTGVEGQLCTAGPMLIAGNETYLLTAGHCFSKVETGPGGVAFVRRGVTSAYKASGSQKEIGFRGKWFYNKERDIAEIKITPHSAEGSFSQPLPTPVPALMAEWEKAPKTPHTVDGEQAVISGLVVCHEGENSGERCGQIKKLNQIGPAGVEHLVEVGACSNSGDSGGPYFLRSKGESIFMMGTEVGGPKPDCNEKGPYTSYFEPLIDLPEARTYGILSSFPGQTLLTTANETRPRKLGILPGQGNTFTSKGGKGTLETVNGTQITCENSSMEGKLSSETAGEATISFKGCKVFGFAANSLGQAKEEIKAEIALTLCYLDKAKVEVGVLVELKNALHIEVPSLATLISVTGSAVGKISPINFEEKTGPFELRLEQGKGKQTQSNCEGGSEESFKTSINGGKAEQSGEATIEETTFKESTEVMG